MLDAYKSWATSITRQDSTMKIKTKTLKQLESSKDNKTTATTTTIQFNSLFSTSLRVGLFNMSG